MKTRVHRHFALAAVLMEKYLGVEEEVVSPCLLGEDALCSVSLSMK